MSQIPWDSSPIVGYRPVQVPDWDKNPVVGRIEPAGPGLPNLKGPTTGQLEPELYEFARQHPETQFDFSSLNQPPQPGVPRPPATGDLRSNLMRTALGTRSSVSEEDYAAARGAVDTLLAPPIIPDTELAAYQRQIAEARADIPEIRETLDLEQRRLDAVMLGGPRMPGPIKAGMAEFYGSFARSGSMLSRFTDLVGLTEGQADVYLDAQDQLWEAERRVNKDAKHPLLNKLVGGTVGTLTDMFTLGRFIPAGAAPVAGASRVAKAVARVNQSRGVITAFTANATNQAFSEGKDAGLRGGALYKYAAGQGAIEAIPMTAFTAAGLGGLEDVPVREALVGGFRQGLKRAGISMLSEVPEENITELASALYKTYAGVDPEKMTPKRIWEIARDTTIQTLFTMGVVETPGVAAFIRRSRAAQDGPTAGPTAGPDTEVMPEGAPLIDPSRLLMGPEMAGDTQAVQAAREAQQQAQEALVIPSSGTTLYVDPQGRAGTEAQHQASETAAAQFVQQIAPPTQLALPTTATGPNFIVDPSGVAVDMENPSGDRRTTDFAAERQEIDALTEAGQLKEARAKIEELKTQARTDTVTQALNRRGWDEAITAVQAKVDKTQRPRRFFLFDLNNFKAKNDLHGHPRGDDALADVVRRIREVVGEAAVVARTGGDEFGVIPVRSLGPVQAQRLLTKIEEAVGIEALAPGVNMSISGGIGILEPGGNLSAAVKVADAATMARKVEGKIARGEALGRATIPPVVKRPASPDLGATTQPPDQKDRVIQLFREAQARQAAFDQKWVNPPTDPAETNADVVDAELAPAGPQVRAYFEGLADIVSPLSSRIFKRSAAIFRRVKQYAFDIYAVEEQFLALQKPLVKRLKHKNGGGRRNTQALNLALMGENLEAANQLLTPDGQAALQELMQLNETLRSIAVQHGVKIEQRPGFILPREVINYAKLQRHLGTERGAIDQHLARAAAMKGRSLTTGEEIAIVNTLLQGRGVPIRQSGARHGRQRSATLTPTTLPFYASFQQAQAGYTRDLIKATARAKFLGQHVTDTESLMESVGGMVHRAIQSGELAPQHQQEMVKLLHGVLYGDMARVSRITRALKQMAYSSTLVQWGGAGLNQLKDVAFSLQRYGLTHTVKGVSAVTWRRAKRMTMEHLGLHAYGVELDKTRITNLVSLTNVVDAALSVAGFKTLDRFGKEVQINAAESFLKAVASGKQGHDVREFYRRYSKVFSKAELDSLLADVRKGQRTSDTRFLQFLMISEIQPVDMTEIAYDYAMNSRILGPIDARILYTLKTFQLKQLDYMWQKTVQEMARGNWKAGARNLAELMALWLVFDIPIDMFKDFIRGKDVSVDQFPDRIVDSMLSLVGVNRYLMNDIIREPIEAIIEYVTPPAGWVSSPITDIREAVGPEESDKPGLRTIRYAPWVGDILYYHMGRGYYLTREQRAKDTRDQLQSLRHQAQDAYERGDLGFARGALHLYNTKRRDGARTGTKNLRKTDLTFEDLRRTAENKD